MKGDKIEKFLSLAGHTRGPKDALSSDELRRLGAQLLLSEVLEYVIKGLGVTPSFNGTSITQPDSLKYETGKSAPHPVEMLDGLADVAYTMYWNSIVFGLPLEDAFDAVCDNNLEKFVALKYAYGKGPLEREEWHCRLDIEWPKEVVQVEVVDIGGKLYAVGKDANGKVRKPSSYKAVDLARFINS